jgi:glycosyltransferase XagB
MEGSVARRAAALDSSIENVLIQAGVRATEQLQLLWPKLSAATLNKLGNAIPLLFGVSAFAAMCAAPSMIVLCMVVVLPTAFRIWVVAHSLLTSSNAIRHQCTLDTSDEDLPIYSVIAALHREAAVVDQLLSAIERLDYPSAKLDVIVAVEADDEDTRAAITARRHRIPITVIPVVPAKLRTKPKALNVALPFARGTFTVIYDAEDRPERNQLRRALLAFHSAGNDLACVQARLCTDTKTGWLAHYFTAEYAGHFDFFLPRLAALGLPLPLGGSSNHFRTAMLREVGGWDPHNVTEDADLGMRLARFGYRSGVIDSTTYEEAPAKIGAWLGQRTRWFKGWMQTWLVHMREPGRLFRELGCGGFLTFQLIVGGNALVAIAHPALFFGLSWKLAQPLSMGDQQTVGTQMGHYMAAATFGYCASASLGFLGLWQRGMLNRAGVLILTPVHWLLLSLAAWSAAIELIRKPYFWKKTEHGVDKRSRQESTIRALLELERYLSELKQNGQLSQMPTTRDSVANRRRHPRVAV